MKDSRRDDDDRDNRDEKGGSSRRNDDDDAADGGRRGNDDDDDDDRDGKRDKNRGDDDRRDRDRDRSDRGSDRGGGGGDRHPGGYAGRRREEQRDPNSSTSLLVRNLGFDVTCVSSPYRRCRLHFRRAPHVSTTRPRLPPIFFTPQAGRGARADGAHRRGRRCVHPHRLLHAETPWLCFRCVFMSALSHLYVLEKPRTPAPLFASHFPFGTTHPPLALLVWQLNSPWRPKRCKPLPASTTPAWANGRSRS